MTSTLRSPVSHFDKYECDIPNLADTSRWVNPASCLASMSNRRSVSYVY